MPSTGTGVAQLGQSVQNIAQMVLQGQWRKEDREYKEKRALEERSYQEGKVEEARLRGVEINKGYNLKLNEFRQNMTESQAKLKANSWLSKQNASLKTQADIQGLVTEGVVTQSDVNEKARQDLVDQANEALKLFKTVDPVGANKIVNESLSKNIQPGKYILGEGREYYNQRSQVLEGFKLREEGLKNAKLNNDTREENQKTIYSNHMKTDLDNVQYQVNGWLAEVSTGKMDYATIKSNVNALQATYGKDNPELYGKMTGTFWTLLNNTIDDYEQAPAKDAARIKAQGEIILNTAKKINLENPQMLKMYMATDMFSKLKDVRLMSYVQKVTGINMLGDTKDKNSISNIFASSALSFTDEVDKIYVDKTTEYVNQYGAKTFNMESIQNTTDANNLIKQMLGEQTSPTKSMNQIALVEYVKGLSNQDELYDYLGQVIIGNSETSDAKKKELIQALGYWRD